MEQLSSLAVSSMIREVELCPKPGLVDRLNNGAHRDMTPEIFYCSAKAIGPFFKEMLLSTSIDSPSEKVLPEIRPAGIRAEKAMFQATGGINTHKGQIFSLGVCLAAVNRVICQPEEAGINRISGVEILMEAGKICRGISEELKHSGPASSHGEKLYREGGYRGIRGEAESGFASVRLRALPRLKKLLKSGCTPEEASLETLILLYSFVEDSNVLHRCGTGGLKMLRHLSTSFLKEGGIRQQGAVCRLQGMNSIFTSMNISPGGCADLLALTLFVHSIEEAYEL
ncbi:MULTISPECIES: triphosphoribosyl-dephospho-CoA synthase [unclassified Oceanispirochaeta]|uniref:triphosphoribosyl-dephospho-CoA synthase n=1 Tax=unclassified Oceanispirochaeta TaxID=2635722 RepID=UPI00131461C9|nr:MULTISPECIES: triphosphoribosyl-dephospho-CoA synthase [unclassified Oceanispirochaeta]MBF9015323.1 triphosphoribosyl-dephospho-CoA synthase [Oceanispirochaeta sp. M2]NPD71781.1 triphosphoribosyl-dephospho-CoA synthase [Oceanispirochaeta sp. M1]